MTSEQMARIAEIRERLKAISPEPWVHRAFTDAEHISMGGLERDGHGKTSYQVQRLWTCEHGLADAAEHTPAAQDQLDEAQSTGWLIANTPTDLRFLLDLLSRSCDRSPETPPLTKKDWTDWHWQNGAGGRSIMPEEIADTLRFANAMLVSRSGAPSDSDRIDLLEKHPAYEPSLGEDGWVVMKVTGYPNDREWHLYAGPCDTLREVLDRVLAGFAARSSSSGSSTAETAP